MGVVVWVEKEERLAHLYLDNKQVGKGFQEQMELTVTWGMGVTVDRLGIARSSESCHHVQLNRRIFTLTPNSKTPYPSHAET